MQEAPDWEGTRVGPYRIEERLGAGGMGAVYRAFDERLERPVALKQILPEAAEGDRARRRFRREARAAARLNHPGIVRIHDLFEAEGCDWIVMELVEGETLAHLMTTGTLSLKRALRLAAEIADALAAAHAEGIVHRDLKARNVLVTPAGHASILDFGLAKQVLYRDGKSTSISLEGQLLGTPQAMSPEQAMGRKVDLRSDLFSFGSLLYEMVTGRAPFRAENPLEAITRVCTHHPPPVKEQRPALPRSLSELIARLLEKDPAHRPRSADEVALALRRIADDPLVEESAEGATAEAEDGELGTGVTVTAAAGRTQSLGERRQVTVMCCDLVAGDETPGSLDLEVFYAPAAEFESRAREVIERFGGHVANVLGHRLVAYFGYPRAHEDDARRAVNAALGVVTVVKELKARFQKGELAVRIGIHTGPAVALASAAQQAPLALGQTLDLAILLQQHAGVNQVLVSHDTRRLTAASFEDTALDPLPLKGSSELLASYRILGTRDMPSQWQTVERTISLVARDKELALLRDHWSSARDGKGRVVLLSGEAGIGKSRLVRAMFRGLKDEGARCLTAQCSVYERNSPFHPLIEMLRRLLQLNGEDPVAEQSAQLELSLQRWQVPLSRALPLFATLFSLPHSESYPPLDLSPQNQRRETMKAIRSLLLGVARQRPVFLVFEDLHWIDPSTLELLDLLVARTDAARMLLVMTFRLEFEAPWLDQDHVAQLSLSRLAGTDAVALIERLTRGKPLPPAVQKQILAKTDGVPLFVEELTKSVLESGQLVEKDGAYELIGSVEELTIPATLRDSLTARLDRLGTAKEVAQLAATIGREFSYELLRAVSPLAEAALKSEIDRLVAAELIYRKGFSSRARYLFRHALIQDAAYDSLLKRERLRYNHDIAQTLEQRFSKMVESRPDLLAHYYTEAERREPAIRYWQRAAEHTMEQSANLEAIEHAHRGLAVVESLPESVDRHLQELPLQSALGAALTAARGFGEPAVAQAYTRAHELCELVGDTEQQFWILRGLWGNHLLRLDVSETLRLGREVLRLAESRQDPDYLFEGHFSLGVPLFLVGELAEARQNLEQAVSLDAEERSHRRPARAQDVYDTGVGCRCWLAWVLWTLGYPDRALASVEQARALSDRISHPFSVAFSGFFALWIHEARRDWPELEARAEELRALTDRKGFQMFGMIADLMLQRSRVERLSAAGQDAQADDALRRLRRGFDAGAFTGHPYSLTIVVDGCLRRGRFEAAEAYLERAVERLGASGERRWIAEVHRLEGELLLARAAEDETVQARVAEHFEKALDVAHSQGALSLELRAALSLGRLWQSQGKGEEACRLLRSVHDRFTEGFDTAALKDARSLLARWS